MSRSGRGTGKPCGGSFIASNKTCTIGLSQGDEGLRSLGDRKVDKSKIAQLKSALQQGTKTREEVGRDLNKLMEQAHRAKNKKMEEFDKLERQEMSLMRAGKVEERQKVKEETEKAWAEIVKLTNAINAKEEKSQIAQLQSILKLGPQTREEVGRDLEGLIEEAKALRRNKVREVMLMSKTEDRLKNRTQLSMEIDAIDRAIAGPRTNATGNTKYAREDARDHDKSLEQSGITQQFGKKSYKWEDSYSSNSKLLGSGAFGTVLQTPDQPVAVKRGEIGKTEAQVMQRVGKADLGPILVSAQLDGAGSHPDTKLGRLAMSVVKGEPLGERRATDTVNGVKLSDAYWTARAQLHRMGIAHNDMHTDNVFVDKTGKGRFVDMGLAQDSPKAALAEAVGAFDKPMGSTATRQPGVRGDGDWQARRYEATGGQLLARGEGTRATAEGRKQLAEEAPVLARVAQNKGRVFARMREDGFTDDDIATILDHGIRAPKESYERGPWGRMTNDQAKDYVNLLYEGV